MNTTTYQSEQAIADGLTDIIENHQLHDLSSALSTALLARILVATAPASGLTQQDLYDTLVAA
ncbi:hypothetical protein B9Z51_12620 [Limnohabitans sp. T6-5]|uniref:hypothetical protein n=1 Tax=Limnohabitans sp. T6-5 TaxID=1100724 RepID=UPI000D35FBBE|nr:hypothetical protein [Limnohabitans sp. T6-5]PUE06777.1 hypothetical protein B9Z51_12620 [Limnohabitans sp. T6-5]